MKTSSKTTIPRVAILVETSRSYTRDLLSGVSRYIQRHGHWSTFLELRAFESSPPPWLNHWDGDGILTRTHSAAMAGAIREAGVPAIELRSTKYNQTLPFVGMDNALIGETVAEHFLNRGYRRFAVYTLDTEQFFRDRVSNFVTRVKQAGAGCESLPAHGETTPEDWEAHQTELIAWIESIEKPVGIFAANDQLAVRLLDACRRAGIVVPEEVAVVGCENETTLCDFASPALTSVKFDGETVGYRAAGLLDKLMQGETVPAESILIPPKGIEVRASSDEYVIEDPVVLRAVKLIREHAFEGITVAEIVKALRVSRSTLERRMKATLKRGTKEEILRLQFREVNRLLRNTDLTIEAISDLAGFTHTHYLQTSYRERYGITPGAYRKKSRQ
ncbi:MAG: DNA-binding transcriptional regulator [Verrucomicrobiales bacterium]|nr:DNA-binding transcriptional regulator [Verrucomicrobiales bacterium]